MYASRRSYFQILAPTPHTVDDSVADLPGGGHDDFLQKVIVDVVIEGVAIGRAEVEDNTHFTGLPKIQ